VYTELRGGQSLKQIIEAHGKSVDEVMQQFTEKAQQHLDVAVEAGKLTQEQADAILQVVRLQATQMIRDEALGEKVEQHLERGVLLALGRATADVTGLPPVTILQRFRAGESLTAIAESEGKTRQEVLDAGNVIYTNRLETAVANGRIAQEEADARLAIFNEMAERLVDEVRTDVNTPAPNGTSTETTP
jgi:polyhydroxyalkanoate synthesis regulator phasin